MASVAPPPMRERLDGPACRRRLCRPLQSACVYDRWTDGASGANVLRQTSECLPPACESLARPACRCLRPGRLVRSLQSARPGPPPCEKALARGACFGSSCRPHAVTRMRHAWCDVRVCRRASTWLCRWSPCRLEPSPRLRCLAKRWPGPAGYPVVWLQGIQGVSRVVCIFSRETGTAVQPAVLPVGGGACPGLLATRLFTQPAVRRAVQSGVLPGGGACSGLSATRLFG